MSIKKDFFAPLALGLGATRRAAMTLLVMMLTMTQAAWAQTTSTINVGGTDYALYTGFTATAGTASYSNFVDGNMSNNWQVEKKLCRSQCSRTRFQRWYGRPCLCGVPCRCAYHSQRLCSDLRRCGRRMVETRGVGAQGKTERGRRLDNHSFVHHDARHGQDV